MQAPTLIRRRYQPLAVVGRGGQGEVVRALDTLHGRHVALKVRRVRSPDEREALVHEASLLLTLRPHAGVALVRDDFFWKGRYYLVLDWIEGKNVASLLAEEGDPGLPFELVLEYLGQVAEALDHLHEHDPPIVHGDVKPANIVVTGDGTAVLVDFGIAAPTGRTSEAMGTPGYRAPELSQGEVTPACDVFSLAATAFGLLAGVPAEPGVTPTWDGIAPSQIEQLAAAFERGLAFVPERRPGSAREFLALLQPPPVPNNLPARVSSFVGRERELTDLKQLLQTTRLLTLTGAGGSGKTRLALELAGQVLWAHPDGAWLAELAPVQDPSLVPAAVAAAIGVREQAGRAVEASLQDALRSRHALLVVDNCEHVIAACAELADGLLRRCPELRILATSREPLSIDGETTWRVPTLASPELEPTPPLAELARFDAVRLFCERARAAEPSLGLNDDTAAWIATVCKKLDGMPLAIEMAAALTRTLPLQELAETVDAQLPLLTGRRTADLRQRTLEATVAWSYDLLSPHEQMLFGRLSVFAGGFSPEAAEAICGDDSLESESVRDLLVRLIARSLVHIQRSHPPRYRLLEPLRVYAAGKLDGEGEIANLRRRHWEYFVTFAERVAAEVGAGADQSVWLERLETDHENLRAACDWSVYAAEGAEPALRLGVALWQFWLFRGHLSQGSAHIEAALARDGRTARHLRARALHGGGQLATVQGDYRAGVEMFEQALRISRSTGDKSLTSRILNSLGAARANMGDEVAARDLFEQSLALRRELGDQAGIANSLHNLGVSAHSGGDLETARALLVEALELMRELRNEHGIATALMQLGSVALAVGDRSWARSLQEESLAIARELRDGFIAAGALQGLGELARTDGDVAGCAACLTEALALRREREDTPAVGESLQAFAGLAAMRGDMRCAARLLAAAAALRDRIGLRLWSAPQAEFEQQVAAARNALGEQVFGAAWADGEAMSIDDAGEEALELGARAEPDARAEGRHGSVRPISAL